MNQTPVPITGTIEPAFARLSIMGISGVNWGQCLANHSADFIQAHTSCEPLLKLARHVLGVSVRNHLDTRAAMLSDGSDRDTRARDRDMKPWRRA